MSFMLNGFAISGVLTFAASIATSLWMFLQGKKRLHVVWGIFCFSVAVWGLGVFGIATADSPSSALWWWRVAYVGVIFIPIFLVHFVHMFLELKRQWIVVSLYIAGVLFLLADMFTNIFIQEVHFVFGQFYYLSPTWLYNLFVVFFFSLVFYAHTRLWIAHKTAVGKKRIQLQYIFLGPLVGFLGGSFSFLPVYNINIYPYLNATIFIGMVAVGYVIVRYKFMDIKVVATQLFIIFLWVFIFIRLLLSPLGSEEQLSNGILLLLTVLVGVFLVRSVMKEVRQREHIESLYNKLREANKHLKELMKIKTEFLQIASHQLRTPLTSLRGLLEMQARGDFRELPDEERGGLQQDMLGSVNQLNNIVNDLLDAMELEGGSLNFKFVRVNVVELIQQAVDFLKPRFDEKGLAITFDKPSAVPEIEADEGYLRQVFLNIINNAEKYTEKGGLTIKLSASGSKVTALFTDTGIGVDPKELSRLFGKFVRGKRSALIHTDGSGLGLFIIKKIVDEHHGNVTLESGGVGQGATARVELPIKQPD